LLGSKPRGDGKLSSGICLIPGFLGHANNYVEHPELIAEYIVHRLAREDEVVLALGHGPTTLKELLPTIYPDVQPHLSWAAMCTLQAQVDKLVVDGRVVAVEGGSWAVTPAGVTMARARGVVRVAVSGAGARRASA